MTYYNTTDFNNENYSYSDEDSSINSFSTDAKKHLKVLNDMKRLDPGFFEIYRKINNKRRKIELYRTSFSPNRKIRNAVTGFYENILVGKYESNLLFKVILATGETGSNPEHLYFDSPNQYENHFKIEVSDNSKREWQQKYNIEVDRQLLMNDKGHTKVAY